MCGRVRWSICCAHIVATIYVGCRRWFYWGIEVSTMEGINSRPHLADCEVNFLSETIQCDG